MASDAGAGAAGDGATAEAAAARAALQAAHVECPRLSARLDAAEARAAGLQQLFDAAHAAATARDARPGSGEESGGWEAGTRGSLSARLDAAEARAEGLQRLFDAAHAAATAAGSHPGICAPEHADAEQGSQALADEDPGPTNPFTAAPDVPLDDQQALRVCAGAGELGTAGHPGFAGPAAPVRELLPPDDRRALLVAVAGLRASLVRCRADLLRAAAELSEERAGAASAAQASHGAMMGLRSSLARGRPMHAIRTMLAMSSDAALHTPMHCLIRSPC